MKKQLLFIAILIGAMSVGSYAQTIELTPYVGYTFGGRTPTGYGEIKVQSSESFGGALAIVMPTDVVVQLEYFRQPTTARYRDYWDSDLNRSGDVNIDWYQLGFLRQIPKGDQLAPFIGISLGATHFDLKSNNSVDEWSFSVALQGGVKIYLTDRIGLRLHARLLMPIQWAGFGFYAGSGGSGTTVNAGTYFAQGDVGAGLIVRLGN